MTTTDQTLAKTFDTLRGPLKLDLADCTEVSNMASLRGRLRDAIRMQDDPTRPACDRLGEVFDGISGHLLRRPTGAELDQVVQARSLLAQLLPATWPRVSSSLDLIKVVEISGGFLSGTTALAPGVAVIASEVLSNRPHRVAEYLFHEAIHLSIYDTYFYSPPFNAKLFESYPCFSPPWHSTPSYWGIEVSLHAYAVYTGLGVYFRHLLATGVDNQYARAGIGRVAIATAALAQYLGERTAQIESKGLDFMEQCAVVNGVVWRLKNARSVQEDPHCRVTDRRHHSYVESFDYSVEISVDPPTLTMMTPWAGKRCTSIESSAESAGVSKEFLMKLLGT